MKEEFKKDFKEIIEKHFGKLSEKETEADVSQVFWEVSRCLSDITRRDYFFESPQLRIDKI